jgi:methylmalonyl-CoA mutase N-terminal domain/subunit
MGGTLRAIESGYVQGEIQNAAYTFQRAVESGEKVIVGVNRFRMENEPGVPVFRIDTSIEQGQVAAVAGLRAGRDASRCAEALEAVRTAARGTENLMARIVAAVAARATVGEIADQLRVVFGEYREAV